ncbi:unnamed protein product [Thlaspi arvense]|uniref:NYN domain-containing protein n=1 Tax=Thlaspi arvense TaxID=13288 RepID=A0AAU9S6Y0_THLAR|nr:unnamed protein product [Thlaspi arvense]
MMHNKATQREVKTLVVWDINGCPIPDDYDPRLVGRRIESALKNSGFSRHGPLTITAIGDLRETQWRQCPGRAFFHWNRS